MYEEMTYEVIMQRLLNRVPDTFDKREGAIIFDALAPAAAELAQLYVQLDVVLNQTFADTATGEYLEKRCAEDMEVAFSMFPTSMKELMAIADSGQVMPPKSTWFEPKLLSGIFIHQLK